jgi:NAD+ diphosphatase
MSQPAAFVPSVVPPDSRDQPAYWFVFRGYRLLARLENGSAQIPSMENLDELGLYPLREQYLGVLDGRHCFSAEIPEDAELPEGWSVLGLRRLYGLLPEELFLVAGAAVQIVDWDRTHHYCGRCGAETHDRSKERAKECPQCGLVSFPRISPAIIVLIEKGDRLLLARSHRHPEGFFSVLAGFVEPGETLEDAVHREIYEEVNIRVKDIRYFGSQPWPFPHSLMIAFTSTYAGGEIQLEEEEMAEADWYSADNMPGIPPKLSIARQLIDWFVARQNDRTS